MLLTVDIGNTNIKLGIYDGDKKIAFKRFETSSDDQKFYYEELLRENNLFGEIDDAIISCVVPQLKEENIKIINSLINGECIIVDHLIDSGIVVDTDNPEEVGSDLITMCSYAYHMTNDAVIVLSFGTANVLCYVDDNACFKYCIIAPGMLLQVNSLFSNAAKLPNFQLDKQNSCLVNDTIKAMNVGVIDGTVGSFNYLISKMKKELGRKEIKIIASGGLGKYVVTDLGISVYNPDLVSDGLRYLYNRCKK